MRRRISGRLGRGAFAAAFALAASAASAAAQDCAYARQNYQQYRATCGSIDGCRQLREAEEYVRRSCGEHAAPRAAPAPYVSPPPAAAPRTPQPSQKTPTHLCQPGTMRFVASSRALSLAPSHYCTDAVWRVTNVERRGAEVHWEVPFANGSVSCYCASAAHARARPAAPQVSHCAELRRYANDTSLYISAWREAADEKIRVLENYTDEIGRIEGELTALAALERDVAWGARVGRIARRIEITAGFIENLLSFVPGASHASTFARVAARTSQRGYEALSVARDIHAFKEQLTAIVREESKLALAQFMLNLSADFAPWLKAIKTIVDLARGIQDERQMEADIRATVALLAKNRRDLERGLARLRAAMLASGGWREIQRGVRAVVERYCAEERASSPMRQP
jgi:hypothetical protein